VKTVKKIVKIAALLTLLAGPAYAGPFEDADDAYFNKNCKVALRLLRPLVEQGDSRAQTLLGRLYGYGSCVPKDPVRAAALWDSAIATVRPLAEKGDAAAQTQLGHMYEFGEGVPRDSNQAALWHRKAADQGNEEAQYMLGVLYDAGWPNDKEQAVIWYRKAADQGSAKSMTALAMLYSHKSILDNLNSEKKSQDYTQAIVWYRKAAEQGDALISADGYLGLGAAFEKGQGVAPDHAQAIAYTHKALELIRAKAEQGDLKAQAWLASLYARGDSLPKNETEAIKWARKAFDGGYLAMAGLIADAYEGIGDYGSAVAWLRTCLSNDALLDFDRTGVRDQLVNMYAKDHVGPQDYATVVDALRNNLKDHDWQEAYHTYLLGWMYEHGQGLAQNGLEAAILYEKAEKKGYRPAQTGLGRLYAEGHGVPQDYAKAIEWYRKAAENGDAEAQSLLGAAYRDGKGVPQDYVLAHMWFNLAASQTSTSAGSNAATNRNYLTAMMAPAQVVEAQRLAREWSERHSR